MARVYGQIMSAIWQAPDFRALTRNAQHTYIMLITQANISSAGTLPITMRRWSQYAIDTNTDSLSDGLSELAAARFIVADGDTEELLVRKFVRWDGGASNPKRRPAITAAANATESRALQAELARELNDLGVPHSLSDSLSDRDTDTPRLQESLVSTDLNPESLNLEIPLSSAIAKTAPPRPDVEALCTQLADAIEANGSRRPTITTRWRDAARLMIDRDKRTTDDIAGAIRWSQNDEFWRTNILSMPTLREQYDRLRLAAQRTTPTTGPPRRSTTDDRVAAALALADRMEADANHAPPQELTP